MDLYSLLRLFHSYWRWAVLIAAVVVLVRAVAGVTGRRAWTRTDERWGRLLVSAVDVQVLIGLVLYFGFSPFWTALRMSFGETMQSPVARFFGIEHGTAALIASAVAHIGWVKAKRATAHERKHKIMMITLIIFAVLVAWLTPWPWRVMGRPLFPMIP